MTGNASMAEQEMLEARALSDWVAVISQVATHYRLSFSPGGLQAMARWQLGKPLSVALNNMARHVGLTARRLHEKRDDVSGWRLPLVGLLKEGQIGVVSWIDPPIELFINKISANRSQFRISEDFD